MREGALLYFKAFVTSEKLDEVIYNDRSTTGQEEEDDSLSNETVGPPPNRLL